MKPTIPYIEKKFEEFNQQMFAGKLPKLPIELSRAKTFLGVCAFKKRRTLLGKTVRYDFRLRISTHFDLLESEVEDTIIHEMIHYYIGVNQLKDTSTHGVLFRQMMNEINEKFGRNVTVSHKNTDVQAEASADTKVRWRVIAVVSFDDGKKGIKVLPKVMPTIRRYCNNVRHGKGVTKVDLYLSNNPFFNRYPSSGAFKVYFLEASAIDEQLSSAQRFITD